MACPSITQPLLLANICLSGGSTNIPNFKTRLIGELRKELPSNWKVNIFDKQYYINRDELSWYGGINLSNELELLQEISISKKIILNMVLIGVNNNLDSKMYKLGGYYYYYYYCSMR